MTIIAAGSSSGVLRCPNENFALLLMPHPTGGVGYAEVSIDGQNWVKWRPGNVASATEIKAGNARYVQFFCLSGSIDALVYDDNPSTADHVQDPASVNAIFPAPTLGRVVKNLLVGARALFTAGWTQVAVNGTTDVSAGSTATFTSNNTTCRLGRFADFNFVAGQKVCISATLSGVSGTFDHSLATNCATADTPKNISTGNGRAYLIFTPTETATRQVYVGINPLSQLACTNPTTLTATVPLIERIPPHQTVPSEHVPPLCSAEFDTECGNTVASGLVTPGTGVRRGVTQSRLSLLIADSLGNDATDFGQIWYFGSDLPILLHATAGTTMAQAVAEWATVIAPATNIVITQSPTLTNSLPAGSTSVALYVMERMINDILISGLSFAQMQAMYETWLSYVAAIGKKTVIFGPTPCQGYGSWSAAKQTIMDQLMAWLPWRCAQTNYAMYFDRYTLLQAAPGSNYLKPEYDLNYPGAPDYLHTNQAAGTVVANELDVQVKRYLATRPY